MAARYEDRPPLMEGAVEAIRRMASRWPLGLASSSPTRLIDLALDRADPALFFAITVSTEEVERGKPAGQTSTWRSPAASEGTGDPCAANEDTSNALRSAARAGLLVVAVPHPRYPPDLDSIADAAAVLRTSRRWPRS
jgi:beta-phosphoglucomutase-like phosphatase (HAD superfamily)